MGDTHGQANTVKRKIDIAKRIGGIERILILGDFGLWWEYAGVSFIDEINEYARANNITIFALPGNHENMKWWNATLDTMPTGAKGFAYLRTNVLLAPRTHVFKWGGRSMAIAGGAVSTDREWRQGLERGVDIRYDPPRKVTPQKVWSEDEQLTDREVKRLLTEAIEPVDILFTHDCSNNTPFRGRFKPDLDSQIHRQRIDEVLKGLTPRLHFHGHMHTKYEWENRVGGDNWTTTYGLECNDDYWSWGVLDLSDGSFSWPDELDFPRRLDGKIHFPRDDA